MARTLAAKVITAERARGWLALSGLALLALSLRVALLWRTGFDGLYGQDPFAYLDYAAAFRDALTQGQWPPPFFWPIGYPALAATLSVFLPLGMAAEVVSIASGVLIAVLSFMIVREILGDEPNAVFAGLVAGVIVSSAGQLLISSLCTMSDAASLFWATLSAFGMLRFRRQHFLRWVALAAFTLGLAVMTRWVYGLLIPIWGVVLVLEQPTSRSRVGIGLAASAFFVLALLPQGTLIVQNKGRDSAAFIGETQDYTWNPLNALQADIVNADGHFRYLWTVGNYYSLPLIEPDFIPIWFTPLVLIGIWALKRRTELVLLLGWFGVMWGFLIGVQWENWRFPLAFFPPLAVLAGVGWHGLDRRLAPRRARFVNGWLGIGLVVMLAWGLYDADAFIGRQLADRAVVPWVSAIVPPAATVLTFGETATLEHYTAFRVFEMASESPESVQAIARDGKDVYVLLNVDNVESQWQGLAPQVNLHALQDHFVLKTIGTRDAYTLYSVVSAR